MLAMTDLEETFLRGPAEKVWIGTCFFNPRNVLPFIGVMCDCQMLDLECD